MAQVKFNLQAKTKLQYIYVQTININKPFDVDVNNERRRRLLRKTLFGVCLVQMGTPHLHCKGEPRTSVRSRRRILHIPLLDV